MIIPGKTAIPKRMIINLVDTSKQAQPCGVDLSLRHVLEWTLPGTVDFSNQFRTGSSTKRLPFRDEPKRLHLGTGSYLVEFNEDVDIPLNIMGQVFVRSSLWRSGALLNAGVMDSGYKGTVSALLQVLNPHGITLHEDARLAQMFFHQMSEDVEGYDGTYQGARSL